MLLLIAIDIDHRKRDKRRDRRYDQNETKFFEVFDVRKDNRTLLLRALMWNQHTTSSSTFEWTPFQLLIKECKISVRKK